MKLLDDCVAELVLLDLLSLVLLDLLSLALLGLLSLVVLGLTSLVLLDLVSLTLLVWASLDEIEAETLSLLEPLEEQPTRKNGINSFKMIVFFFMRHIIAREGRIRKPLLLFRKGVMHILGRVIRFELTNAWFTARCVGPLHHTRQIA